MIADDQFSGANTPNQQGYFLGSVSAKSAGQPVTEDRKEEERSRLKLVRSSRDPYEAFKEDDFLYPLKEDEMTVWQKFMGENQQGMPVIATGKCSLFCNMVCCFYFLIFGLVFMGIASSITEYSFQYDTICNLGDICLIPFTVSSYVKGPIFVYYELNEFYQSHQAFASSIIPDQMAGNTISQSQYDLYCSNVQTYEQLQRVSNQSTAGFFLDQTLKINPCGIAAKYIFNDTFQLFQGSQLTNLYLNTTSISFSIDNQYKYNRNKFWQFNQWLDLNDEKVMNWFNIQSLPLIRKLWGRYDGALSPDNYTIAIMNSTYFIDIDYPTTIFGGGSKRVYVTTLSSFGSKNYSFAYLLIVASSIQFVSGIVIYIRHRIIQKKELDEQKVHIELKLKEKQD